MKKQKNFPSFLAGMATMALTVTLAGTALAAGAKVEYNRAGVALCGQPQVVAGETWTAPNGQKVPTMITYVDAAGGKTNYLSLRQISDMLNIPVRWNAEKNQVELGDERARIEFVQEGYLNAVKRTVAGEKPLNLPESTLPKAEDTVLRGDTALIQARGGTLLPDDDPGSYVYTAGGTDWDGKIVFSKQFETKNSTDKVRCRMDEYPVGNLEALTPELRQQAEKLPNGVYPVNSRGETYGNSALANFVGYYPDLIRVSNGKGHEAGYIVDRGPDGSEQREDGTYPLYNAEHEQIGSWPEDQ